MKPATASPQYWRSLSELTRTPEFQEAVRREFPGDDWDRLPPATRRQFLKVMGASLALAGLTSCRWPKEEIVPFAYRPEGRTPGAPLHFATSVELSGVALGMMVTSYDGRPVKVEGNELHPDSLGALSAAAQANVLELYDPERSRAVVYREGGQDHARGWDDFAALIGGRLVDGGRGFAVLSEASSSPSFERLRSRFLGANPEAAWHEYEPISRDNEREGLRIAYGRVLRPQPRLDLARVVACFDADPLMDHPTALRLARQLAEARNPEGGTMSRLHVAESAFTLTGGMADHRLAVASGGVPDLLARVARELVDAHGLAVPAALAGAVVRLEPPAASRDTDRFVTVLAEDLAGHRGRSLILVGPRQAPEVHALAAVLNAVLDPAGETLTYTGSMAPDRPTHLAAITDLAGRISAGAVQTLVIIGGNPAYDAPADLDFGELLRRVPVSVHLGLYDDETSHRCTWHLPRAHNLEAWGDGRAWDGTVTMRQPLIEPLYGGRSAIEVLATMLGDEAVKGYDIVREGALEHVGDGDPESAFRRMLHDGVVTGSSGTEVRPDLEAAGLDRLGEVLPSWLAVEAPAPGRLELVVTADPKVGDGRFANSAWLQELPDPVTKVTWDNALQVSPVTARDLGVADGDVVAVVAGDAEIELPVCVVPGAARGSLRTTLGYGRTAAGRVGNGVGVDAYRLRTSDEPAVLQGVTVRPTGRRHQLATTQDHHAIDLRGFETRNRRVGELVRGTSLDEYLDHPGVIRDHDHHPPLVSLWKEKIYEGEQWGMAIDLNSCIGCNACVIACQAENNIPVVGRQQVVNQREMHWIRIDRYFKTEPGVRPEDVEAAELVFQPMTCVHCENAPCEQVCPVAATQHTEDGLNAMVYNRCVGTRYCSNNCPFKVRRFNFFNYHKGLADVSAMLFNPEVTVRSRGVMEKCSYCVQRIESARIQARNDDRALRDGEVVPACAQTCPTRAIVFGNLNDPQSEVARLREEERSYATLAELNIKPRTHYLARLRNPAAAAGVEPPAAQHRDAHGSGKESA